MKHCPAYLSQREQELLRLARGHARIPALEALDAEQLRELAATEGIDVATVVLFDRVCRSDRYAEFIASVERLEQEPCPCANCEDILFAVAPGAFWKELPHIQADGRLLRKAAAGLGCATTTIPVPSTGGLRDNAERILAWLRQQRSSTIVLASLSKGSADVRIAMQREPSAFQQVIAWINVCGMMTGTPLAARLLSSRWRLALVRLLFWCRRFDFQMVRDLRPGLPGLVTDPLVLPEHLQLISVVGFPLNEHLRTRRSARWRRWMNPLGPNDGGVLLHDVCQLPGLMYPVWGADHYLQPRNRDMQGLAAALLKYVDQTRIARGRTIR